MLSIPSQSSNDQQNENILGLNEKCGELYEMAKLRAIFFDWDGSRSGRSGRILLIPRPPTDGVPGWIVAIPLRQFAVE